jgi:raffinose/stachyose/melibiose transport system permease protein
MLAEHITDKKKGSLHYQITAMGLLFMAPAVFMIMITTVIPLFWNIALSFMEWNGNSPAVFAKLDNYIKMFTDPKAYNSILRSLFIGAVSSSVSMILGVFLALCVYRLSRTESAFCRFIFFSPSMLPTTVVGLLFVFVLAPDDGIVNAVLGFLHRVSWQKAWLANPKTVLWTLAIVQGWKTSGTVMMLFYTGLIQIPPSFFEAGRIEGATYFHEIKMIIMPLLRPTFTLALSMTLLSSFRTYDIVWTMTRGGPGDISKTAPIRIIESGFLFSQFGYAAALGVILTIVVSICIVVTRFFTRGESYEY